MKKLLILVIFVFLSFLDCYSQDYVYILNEKCVTDLYNEAVLFFKNQDILAIKESQGLRLRFELVDLRAEIYGISPKTYEKILLIKDFLAKIENPVIIEVHIREDVNNSAINLKKWEYSTVIANRIESIILKNNYGLNSSNVASVGYGEFLPAKNTSNNGSNYLNRVDIMILCKISGE